MRGRARRAGSSAPRIDDDEASDWDLFVVLPDDAPPGIGRPSALRRAAAAFDANADWSISFRCQIDDPLQTEPLPGPGEVSAWFLRIGAFRAEVASLIAAPPG